MKRGIVALIVSLLLFLPLVTGATMKCPSRAPADKVVCRLEGNGTGKLYLKSVDGIPPRGYLITIRDSKGYKHSINDEWDTFELPANISFSIRWILSGIKDHYFDFVPDWVLFNKKHTFMFVFIGENGTQKTFDVRVYVEGKPNWAELEDNLIISLIASFLTGFVALGLLLLATWGGKRKNKSLTYKFAVLSGLLLILLMAEFYFLGPNTFGLLYYYFGTGKSLYGDIVFGLSIWVVLILVTILLWGYYIIPLQLSSVAYNKSLSKLKHQRTYPLFGLSWALFPFLFIYPLSKLETLLLIVGFFILATRPALSKVRLELVLLVNLAIAGFLMLKYRPDFAFVAFLIVLLFVMYFIQKKCFKRFTAEKERLIAEIEEKVAKIEGAGR
ncbi:hypothetical protein [Thermococcus sp. 21S9]|uniref:hypothetical protein n=1 Tax=Thermococcus sp. 21S9 TaxID=1638223 RepID=UPI00143B86D0|nr:hypothetical protein [Thermococcus sp. 21S9]NJE55588.1 hypothetical protein [Thermococcus sp. 21S9]